MKLYIDKGMMYDEIHTTDDSVRMICAMVNIVYEVVEEVLIPKYDEIDGTDDNRLRQLLYNAGREIETAAHADMIVTMDWEVMPDVNVICWQARKYGIPVIGMADLLNKVTDIFMKKGTAMEYESEPTESRPTKRPKY